MKILVSLLYIVLAATPFGEPFALAARAGAPGTYTLTFVNQAEDNDVIGVVRFDPSVAAAAVQPGANWEFILPNSQVPVPPRKVEIVMCRGFWIIGPALPKWASDFETAGAYALTEESLRREIPVGFELSRRAVKILNFRAMVGDSADEILRKTDELVSWLNRLEYRCTGESQVVEVRDLPATTSVIAVTGKMGQYRPRIEAGYFTPPEPNRGVPSARITTERCGEAP